MEKIIHKLINEFIEGIDTYTHNGSTWLIFTESKQWVIELTKEKTLWYNYTFFKEVFEYTSMDVVENQNYITKWVEDNIINGVKGTPAFAFVRNESVEDTLQNGVKQTVIANNHIFDRVEDTIQNGIKETKYNQTFQEPKFQDALQNGVKEIQGHGFEQQNIIDDIVKNGVKETKTPGKDGDILGVMDWMEENKTNSVPKMIDDIIENGVKVSGTFVGGTRQKENIESVIGYGTKNPSV